MEKNTNLINIAILGAVSAGKSTLLNALHVSSYSDMKIKRTTMTPQVYIESDSLSQKESRNIRNNNTKINKEMNSMSEGELNIEDIKETIYIVPRIKNLHNLKEKVHLAIYDLPGLNDSQTKDIYFQYLEENFYKFDIILFVVDIRTAINTSDESDILKKILENAKKSKEEYGIQQKLIVLANKCDDLNYDSKTGDLEFENDELEEMYDQIEMIVKERINNIFPDLEYKLLPLSSQDTYIYRMYQEDPTYELDIEHINKFGYNENGRANWNRLGDEEKKNKIIKLMSEMNIEERLLQTGFKGLSDYFKDILNEKNQYKFLINHLKYELCNIQNYNKLDITQEVEKFYTLYKKFNEIHNIFDFEENIFYEYLDAFMVKYKNTIVIQYIDINTKKLKQEDIYLHQVTRIKELFDNYDDLIENESDEIIEIRQLVTESLNNFYVSNIENNSSSVDVLFDYLDKLHYSSVLCDNYENIIGGLVSNIFLHPDMKNQKPEIIIRKLDALQEKYIINLQDKRNILLDFLTNLYKNILEEPIIPEKQDNNKTIPRECRKVYFYYADLFWTRYNLKQIPLQLNNKCHKGIFNNIGYLAKENMLRFNTGTKYGAFNQSKINLHNLNITEILPLEIHLFHLENRNIKPIPKKRGRKPKK